MARIISIFVGLFFASSAFAQFSEEDVVKRISTKKWVSKSKMNEAVGDGLRAEVYFEFLLLKDNSLWLRPLLSESESRVKFGFRDIDRTEPVKIEIKGFVPVEFFELGRKVYVVVRQPDSVGGKERYLVNLEADLGPKPSVSNALLDGGIIYPGLGATFLHGTGFMGNIVASVLTVITTYKFIVNMCAEMDNCQARTEGEISVRKNSEGYPVTVARYVIDPLKAGVLRDVIVKDSAGKEYSLRTGETLPCENGVTAHLAGD